MQVYLYNLWKPSNDLYECPHWGKTLRDSYPACITVSSDAKPYLKS